MEHTKAQTSYAAAAAPPLTAAHRWPRFAEAVPHAAAAPASHAQGSSLSRLERIITGGLPLSGTGGNPLLSELPLLWAAVQRSTPSPPATAATSPSAAASFRGASSGAVSAAAVGDAPALRRGGVRAREGAAHARFIRECTSLLWGGDYPAWLEQLWVRDGEDGGEAEEREGEEESERRSEASSAGASSASSAHDGGSDAAAKGGAASRPPPPPDVWGSGGASVTQVLQQALEALHLRLPLQQQQPRGSASGSKAGGSDAGSEVASVQALAAHLVHDAPLLWLRFLLVPMYTQWTQQRHTTAAAGAPPTSERDSGGGTMHCMLNAVAAAVLPAALAREDEWADALMDLVTEAQAAAVSASPTALAAARRRLRERRVALQDEQRQHIGEVMYFTGTLARAAQSFMVLGHGGHALLAVLLRRLVGEARASWAEWAGRLTAVQLRDVAHHLSGSTAETGVKAEVTTEEAEERRSAPGAKRPRVEAAPGDAAADAFAAVRVTVQAAAREHARLLWRCWYVLYGFYGADLYTDDAVARALAEEDMEKAGVRRMPNAQQEHWRRLRLAADVKQYSVSETHWLWLQCLLAAAERTMSAALQRAHRRGGDDVRKSGRAAAADGAGLYECLVRDAVHAFLGELRAALRVYGEAVLALRTGVLHSTSTTAMPVALQALAHNITALQDSFARSLIAGLACAPSALPSLRRTSGVYLWQLQPTLLRVQAPEEGTWMSTTGGEQPGDGVGATDAAEATASAFADAFQRRWRQRARVLTSVLADANHVMERTLMHGRSRPAMTTPSGHLLAPPTTTTTAVAAVEPGMSAEDGEQDAAEGVMMAGLLSALVHAAPATADARGSEGGAASAVLGGIAADFAAVFDQSCFFVLRPERQRLFTRSVERLHELLRESGHAPLLRVVRGDARLWMLLVHGTLLQLERRGRMAREDEALLASHLLPLLVLLDSRGGPGAAPEGAAETSNAGVRSGEAVWADTAVARHVLVLLASGMTTLPWDVEQAALLVQRHIALCQRYASAEAEGAHMASWFAAPDDTARTASALTSTMPPPLRQLPGAVGVPLSSWDALDAPVGSSSPAADGERAHAGHGSGSGAAALAREIDVIDAQSRHGRDLINSPAGVAQGEEDGCSASPTIAIAAGTASLLASAAGLPAAAAPPRRADEDAVEARLAAALMRHGRAAAGPASLAPAPCALLLVVGAYRTCARALHVLRAALEEQHRMAREDEVGEFVGRAATFCTTDDIAAFRGVLETVHHCVFASAVRPWGLVRLWMGYLQHLFLCVVPRSAAADAAGGGDGAGGAEADSLVLMPSSWQQRRHVASIFGARVYRTGWRALQHDGEPASQTRLREVLGECLADLVLLPYTADMPSPMQAVLQHTLPHAVLGVLCELLHVPVDSSDADSSGTAPHTGAATDAGA